MTSDTEDAGAALQMKPASDLARIALAGLEREYRRSLDTIIRAAAAVEGVDLAAGWRLDETGNWARTAPDGPKGASGG